MHGAHAAASLPRAGGQIRAACDYHQADWPSLIHLLDETLAAALARFFPPVWRARLIEANPPRRRRHRVRIPMVCGDGAGSSYVGRWIGLWWVVVGRHRRWGVLR
ncbi:hypothetical protein GCM10023108_30030 [Saccharopolyspora hordei]